MNDRPVWERDGGTWPNRDKSRFVDAAGLRWHVQIAGQGPVLLLIHGTAAATHSWGALLPLLAEHYRVVAPDLPGHGFTSAPAPKELSLPRMAAMTGELLATLELQPQIVVGHSAGAAILCRMCLDGLIDPRVLISLSGALLPLQGFAGKWFSPAAKLLARSSLAPRMVAHRAKHNPAGMERLVDGTGSKLTPDGVALYRLLVSSPGHVAAALNMMANWDLTPMERDLPRLKPRLVLVGFTDDQTVPPEEAERAKALVPAAKLAIIGGYGHLAHEEDAARIAELIFASAG
ncbi:MAG: alpha/beta fold hydrolase [Thiohalocapsa sp.]|nr:alpha/beta fold hydrolase [Thiohalocapsa sp.]